MKGSGEKEREAQEVTVEACTEESETLLDNQDINDCECPEVAFFDLYGTRAEAYSHNSSFEDDLHAFKSRTGEEGVQGEFFENPFGDFEVEPHPLEHILEKLNGKMPAEEIFQLRCEADSLYYGDAFEPLPTAELVQQVQREVNQKIHERHHLTKKTAQASLRGGGRPSSKQKKRAVSAFVGDLASQRESAVPSEIKFSEDDFFD